MVGYNRHLYFDITPEKETLRLAEGDIIRCNLRNVSYA